jgi:hypothetical protein
MQNHLEQSNPHLSAAQARMRTRNEAEQAGANAQLYSIDQLAVLHNLSRQTVVRMYEREPGVLIDENVEHQKNGTRRRRKFQVPRHVYRRVVRRIEVK